ncbi:acyl-CoA dehydrogenase family protein [Niallia sp. XMNu-256]|uniref:acyl-CoA dehydrogenase family protein n=1 Tax=Niallia sp. XMNu-256 TaxID=3082444 RepID=UPI0030CF729D
MKVKLRDEQIYMKLMESAKRIGQLAEEEALQADQDRTISQNVVDVIIEEGINKLILPKEYGYPQIDFKTFADMVKTVGYYNLSAAWLTYFYSLHNSWISFLPKHRMDEIVADGGLIADIFAPVGKVERCEGGYYLSGKWNYVSGVNYSEWIGLAAVYQFEGEDQPDRLGLCCRVSDLTVLNDWDTLGLRGSGSNSVIADNLFVPEDMTFRFSDMIVNRKPRKLEIDEDYLYYNVPFFAAFYIGFPAMAMGAAERVLDEYKERTSKRTRIYGNLESASPVGQRIMAELSVKHKASIGLMKEYINMLENDNGEYNAGEYNAIRVTIIQNCIDIAVKATLAIGATGIKKGIPFEIITRDLIAIGTHITSLYDDGIEAYGKSIFGFDHMALG